MDKLLQFAISKKGFNTNNDWGFGGAVGTQFNFKNDVHIRVGRASYRHLPSSLFTAVYHDGKRIIDEQYLKETHIAQILKLIA